MASKDDSDDDFQLFNFHIDSESDSDGSATFSIHENSVNNVSTLDINNADKINDDKNVVQILQESDEEPVVESNGQGDNGNSDDDS